LPGGTAVQLRHRQGRTTRLRRGVSWQPLPGAHRFVDPLGLPVDPRGSNVYVTDHTGYRAPGGGSWFGIWHPKDDAEGFVLKLPAA
jgi:hypothetical protein